jgi:stress-induced morphogen
MKLTIVDESHKHAGHAGNPSGDANAETHFKCGGGGWRGAAGAGSGGGQRGRAPPARCRRRGSGTTPALRCALPTARLVPLARPPTPTPPPPHPPRPCRVSVVSEEFAGKRLVQRHQMLYRLLDDEIKAGVHALSMETKTPEEAGL